MAQLRRGFKAQSERRSVEVRKSLQLGDTAPLQAFQLADHLGITAWSAADVPGLADEDRRHLLADAMDEWSAFVLTDEGRHLVVYNPSQSPARINSVVMHELSHIMLGHELPSATTTDDGHLLTGSYDEEQEAEADWLGGTLLLPRPALLWMRSRKLSDEAAADHFGVSLDMLRWRVRMTGIDYQVRRYG